MKGNDFDYSDVENKFIGNEPSIMTGIEDWITRKELLTDNLLDHWKAIQNILIVSYNVFHILSICHTSCNVKRSVSFFNLKHLIKIKQIWHGI